MYGNAAAVFTTLAASPDCPAKMLYRLGQCQRRTGNMVAAAAAYQRCLSLKCVQCAVVTVAVPGVCAPVIASASLTRMHLPGPTTPLAATG